MTESNFVTMQERINEMYKYAFSAGMVASKTDFADKVGIAFATISRYLNGKMEPSKKVLAQMNAALGFPFNEQWLLVGTGEMMSDGTSVNPNTQSSDIRLLITEMRESRQAKDEQIDRLLRIIENMQAK